jgi:AraC-like DNA-binding protein
MSDIKYERHLMQNPKLPFIFHNISITNSRSGVTNWHDNIEFLHCTNGEGFVDCDSNHYEMKKGDTIIVNSRCLHKTVLNTGFNYHCLIVDNSFFKDNGVDIENIVFNEKVHDNNATEKMNRIASCINENDSTLYVAHTRLAVLDYICYMTDNYSYEKTGKQAKKSKSYTAVLDTIEYINNHFAEKLVLEDLASRAGFSRFHFSRIFKESTGITMIEHINARRCDSAGYLLRKTDKPISEIGIECGFDSPSYFAKAFSASYGVLPSEYRKKYSKS